LLDKVQAVPQHDGLSAPQVQALTDTLAIYESTLAVCTNPATRTRTAILAKDAAKKAFVTVARQCAQVIQKNPATTDARRAELGLTVPKPRSPIAPPTATPRLDVVAVAGRLLTLRLHDGSGLRGKPAGVTEARIFSYSGENPPEQEQAWNFEAAPTRTETQITPAAAIPGVRLWLKACWVNAKAQAGPMCAAVSTSIQGVAGEPPAVGNLEAAMSQEAGPKLAKAA
jgi:hypothetical protein